MERKEKQWNRMVAIFFAVLLLWWLFLAILINEEKNQMELPETEFIAE